MHSQAECEGVNYADTQLKHGTLYHLARLDHTKPNEFMFDELLPPCLFPGPLRSPW